MLAKDGLQAEIATHDPSTPGLFNAARAAEFMRRYDLDAILATSPASVAYVSDYHCWLDSLTKEYMLVPGGSEERALETYALVPLAGEPALVVPALLAANAKDLWIRDLYAHGDAATPRSYASAAEALAAAVRARGLERGRVGLEEEGLRKSFRGTMRELLPAVEFRDCTNLLRLIRTVKTDVEIERLTRAAEIAEEAAQAALAGARAHSPVSELVQRFKLHVVEQGADFDHFAFGVRGFGIAMEASHFLQQDDVMYVDVGCVYRHCFSDTGLTLALRKPAPWLQRRYRCLHECLQAGADQLRAGRPGSTVWAAMRQSLGQRGASVLTQGHGLGVEVREYPLIGAATSARLRDRCVDEAADLALEEGMVVNLEASLFIPGRASLHIERSFLVAADGGRPLVDQPRDAPFQPAAAD